MAKLDELADAAGGRKRSAFTSEMEIGPAPALPPFPTPREPPKERCRFCRELIAAGASRCPHCQSWFSARLRRRYGAVTKLGVIEALIWWSLILFALGGVIAAIGIYLESMAAGRL